MRALIPLSLVAALAACAHAPPPAPAPAAAPAPSGEEAVRALFPLAVGAERTWEDRSPALPEGQRGATRTVRIVERTADGYFRDDDRGELRFAEGCVEDRVRRLLCGPLAVGTSWSSVTGLGVVERFEIVGVGEEVQVPAGRFPGCVRVRSHVRGPGGSDLVGEITYAPGVGPVRLETLVVVGGAPRPQVSAVLRGYRAGGP